MNKYLCLIGLISLIGCTKNTVSKEVQYLVDERMKMYYRDQDSICKANATLKAEKAVDSFFLSIRQQYLHDSINVPIKPTKPMIDTNIQLDETTPVKPLWDTLKIK